MVKNLDLRVRKGNISFQRLASELGVHMNTVRYWFNSSEMDGVRIRRVLNAIETIERKERVS